MTTVRAGAKFCSARCRVYSARNAQKLPEMLTKAPRFVRFNAEKVPLTVAGCFASSTDPSTWTTHESARRSEAGVGMGFVLNGDGIGVVDLDHCIENGVIAPWAQDIVDANAGTFIETSISGTGLHIWGQLAERPGRVIRDGRNIEIYTTGRYIALGKPLAGASKALRPIVLP